MYGYANTIGGQELDLIAGGGLSASSKNELSFTKDFANARGLSRDIHSKSIGPFAFPTSQAMESLYSEFDKHGINRENATLKALVLVEDNDGKDEVKTCVLDYMGSRVQYLYGMNINGFGDIFDDYFSGRDYKKGQVIDVSPFWEVAYKGMIQNVANNNNATRQLLSGDDHLYWKLASASGMRRVIAKDSEAPPSEQRYYKNSQFLAVMGMFAELAGFAVTANSGRYGDLSIPDEISSLRRIGENNRTNKNIHIRINAKQAAIDLADQFTNKQHRKHHQKMVTSAYDIETGMIATVFNGEIPGTLTFNMFINAEKAGGFGEKVRRFDNKSQWNDLVVGRCSEYRAANILELQGSKPENIRFIIAREVRKRKDHGG